MLRTIVDDVYGQAGPDRQHALASINGIAGWAKGGLPSVSTPEQMLARLRGRFSDRSKHQLVMDHPRFEEYLARKAEELASQ